jgi:3-hydroxymyristoyl/3-hydroxydecanoyl-(acyl carrier protein) dehydratase
MQKQWQHWEFCTNKWPSVYWSQVLEDQNWTYATICNSSINALFHVSATSLRLVQLVDQELPTFPKHLISHPIFSGVRVTRSLVLCIEMYLHFPCKLPKKHQPILPQSINTFVMLYIYMLISNTEIYVAPLGHIKLIPSQSFFDLSP